MEEGDCTPTWAQRKAELTVYSILDPVLINTGWVRGKFGTGPGKRCPLVHTRRIVDAIHDGTLAQATFHTFEPDTFKLQIHQELPGVPSDLLNPAEAWADKDAYAREVRKLAGMFGKAFKLYESEVQEEVRNAGPQAH